MRSDYGNSSGGKLRISDVGKEHHSSTTAHLPRELFLKDVFTQFVLHFGHLRRFLFLVGVPIVALKLERNESHILQRVTTQDRRCMPAVIACGIGSHDLADLRSYFFFADTWSRIGMFDLAHNNLRLQAHCGWINFHEFYSVGVVHSAFLSEFGRDVAKEGAINSPVGLIEHHYVGVL